MDISELSRTMEDGDKSREEQVGVERETWRAELPIVGGVQSRGESWGQQPQDAHRGAAVGGLDGTSDSEVEEEDEEDDDDDGEEDGNGSSSADQVPWENPYAKYVEDGMWRVADALVEPVMKHAACTGWNEDHAFKRCVQVLIGTRDSVRKEMTGGNLHKEKQDFVPPYPGIVSRQLQVNMDAADKNVPCVYVWEFCKRGDGQATTPKELLEMADIAERYLNARPGQDKDLARKIDNWKNPKFSDTDFQNGRLRYLPSVGSRDKLEEFLAALRESLKNEDPDEELAQPLREIGYTDKGGKRLDQHRRHTSSNDLMNLFEAISGAWAYGYTMNPSIIYLCGLPELAVAGEIVWSLLGGAYSKYGRGFNAYDAGESNNSAWQGKTATQVTEWAEEAVEASGWIGNLKQAEQELADAVKERDRLEQELADLQRRITAAKDPVEGDTLNRIHDDYKAAVAAGRYVGREKLRETHEAALIEAYQEEWYIYEGILQIRREAQAIICRGDDAGVSAERAQEAGNESSEPKL